MTAIPNADKMRDELLSRRAKAEAVAAKAQEAAAAAERALRLRQAELATDARTQYLREHVWNAGGMLKRRNDAAEHFVDAVRSGDGAAILSAWVVYRREVARAGAIASTVAPGEFAQQPEADFAANLNAAVKHAEAEAAQAGAAEVEAFVVSYVDSHIS